MRLALTGFALVACAASPAGPAAPLPVDVIIGDGTLRVVPRVEPTAPQAPPPDFSPPGLCAVREDTSSPPPPTCLTEVTLDGTVVDRYVRPAVHAGSVLELAGCGDPVTITLDDITAPTPIASVARDELGRVAVDWTTEAPSPTALVTIHNGLAAWECHVAPATGRFVFAQSETLVITTALVQAFAAVDERSTPIGPVRIWRGNTGVAFLDHLDGQR